MLNISERAKRGYREKINPGTRLSDDQLTDIIQSIFDGSRYISDNERGILFRNDMLRIELIVKNKEVVALYPVRRNGNGCHR